jgi:hypothetical protein
MMIDSQLHQLVFSLGLSHSLYHHTILVKDKIVYRQLKPGLPSSRYTESTAIRQ